MDGRFDNGRTNVGGIGIEFGVGVGERRERSEVDATLHRDDSPAAKPEGCTLNFSAEAGRGADSSGGVEDVLIVGGTTLYGGCSRRRRWWRRFCEGGKRRRWAVSDDDGRQEEGGGGGELV